MPREILAVAPTNVDPTALARAADVLQRGGLVAFPTETVYGLGAHALNPQAVQRIFEAKARPPRNPVIVHVRDAAAARELVSEWPAVAEQLSRRFWPGPLTLILPRAKSVPDIVTGGGPNVGVRVPAHPVALGLLRVADLPIAAPSANPSTRLSATSGRHVRKYLDAQVDLLLDAGPTPGGIESTIVDCTRRPLRILRPGLISAAQLEATLGEPVVPEEFRAVEASAALPAPGQMARHYAPITPLELQAGPQAAVARAAQVALAGLRVGLLLLRDDPVHSPPEVTATVLRAMPPDATEYARVLYATLHDMDEIGLGLIVVELPPAAAEWAAVHDRLRRAAAPLGE